MNILVTGASGFIGQNLVKSLVKNKEYNVICLVRPKSFSSFKKNSFKEVIEADILDKNLKNKVKHDIDVIIHLAAIKQHYKSKSEIFKVNFIGTKNLLDSFTKVKHFIFPSTSIAEPRTNYSQSKWESEQIIKKKGIQYTILRIGPVFGRDDETNISKLIKMLNDENLIPIPGKGEVEIQPLHIDDLVYAIQKIIMNKKFFNRICHIAGEPILFKNFAEQVCKVLNKKYRRIHIPIPIMKIIVKIYQSISRNPIITVEQIENFQLGSEHHMDSDFHTSPLDETIKKSI